VGLFTIFFPFFGLAHSRRKLSAENILVDFQFGAHGPRKFKSFGILSIFKWVQASWSLKQAGSLVSWAFTGADIGQM